MKVSNKMRFPAGTGPNFREGWRACEAGQTLNDNPYIPDGQSGAEHLALMAKEARWSQGFRARSDEAAATNIGESLGRPSVIPSKEVAECVKIALRRIRINRGGYDSGGAYWGVGRPLYWAGDDAGIVDMWFRARDRADAKAQVIARCPNAMFYR